MELFDMELYDIVFGIVHWLLIFASVVYIFASFAIINEYEKYNNCNKYTVAIGIFRFIQRCICPIVIGFAGLALILVHDDTVPSKYILITECVLFIIGGCITIRQRLKTSNKNIKDIREPNQF